MFEHTSESDTAPSVDGDSQPLAHHHDASRIFRDTVIEALPSSPQIYLAGGTRVVHLSETEVVKYGPDVRLCEARTMQYVRKRSTIRLPRVLDAWSSSEANKRDNPPPFEVFWEACFEEPISYIVMTYLPGRTLKECWTLLNNDEQHSVARQLSESLHELHSIKVERPGPIGGGVSHGALFTDYGPGPFETVEEMETWFNERLEVCRDFNKVGEWLPSFSGKFSNLVICHMDLHLENMLLDGNGQLWLIDWGCSGAYPEHFETASVTYYGHWPRSMEDMCKNGNAGDDDAENISHLHAIGFALTTGAFCGPRRPNGLLEGTFKLPYKQRELASC